MEQSKRDLITSNKVSLANQINLDSLLQVFKDKQSSLFPTEWMNVLESTTLSLEQRKQELLESVPKRGPQAFDEFVEGLKTSKQYAALKILFPDTFGNIIDHGAAGEPSRLGSNLNGLPGGNQFPEDYDSDLAEDEYNLLTGGPFPYYGGSRFDERTMYRMESSPRGLALIINNIKFKPGSNLEDRLGSENDHLKMRGLLEYLGFEVLEPCLDKTREEMYKELKAFANNERHDKLDAAVVVIMTHGQKDGFYGVDGYAVFNVQTMCGMFNATLCPILINKPKVFLLNLCRGDNTQQGVFIESYNPPKSTIATDSGFATRPVTIPEVSDIMIFHSTIPDHVSLRDTGKGAWFIISVVRIFRKFAHKDSYYSMCQEAKRYLARKFVSQYGSRQSGETSEQGAVRTLYFNPPSTTVPYMPPHT